MSPDVFRKLAALGLDHDQMAGVLEIMDAAAKAAADADEARKAKGRERWHRWQDKRQSNVSQHEQTLANDSHASVTRVEDNLLTKKISGQEEKKDTSPPARSKRGERIPDDFQPDIAWAQSQGLSPSDAQHEASQFLDFWRAKPGKDGLKLDWPGTWRVWVRNTLKRRSSSTGPPYRKRNFADVAHDNVGRLNGSESIFGGGGDAEFLPPRIGKPGPDDEDLRSGIARRFGVGRH